jgi:lipopolysaccharide/colanic/teichoic acid biosynthesis glycosyltransferase
MTPTSLVTAQNSAGSQAKLETPNPQQTGPERGSAVPTRPTLGMRLSLAWKQFLDFMVAAALMLVTSPVFLVTALAIKLTSRGPVFYVQERVGRSGQPFRFYKFRTMRHDADDKAHRDFARNFIQGSKTNGPTSPTAVSVHDIKSRVNGRRHRRTVPGNANGNGNGNGKRNGRTNGKTNGNARIYKMTADPRVTSVGRFLRRTSLDELPQIFNVLRGEMSMVGPRPPVPYEVDHYQEWHKGRLAVKPGITGLWQVSGRSSVPFDEMVLLDLYYIENRSSAMDLRIMAKTIPVMVKGDGAY